MTYRHLIQNKISIEEINPWMLRFRLLGHELDMSRHPEMETHIYNRELAWSKATNIVHFMLAEFGMLNIGTWTQVLEQEV
jgi:hypothetical protein